MPTDPVAALIDLTKNTPDPRAISNWLNAYLGTRPHDAKVTALEKLTSAFSGRTGGEADQRVATMVLRIIRRAQEELAAAGSGKRRK